MKGAKRQDGAIGGPNAYLDSIFLYADASTAGKTLTAFIDTVAYNPNGDLAALIVPEPGCLPIVGATLATCCCRCRAPLRRRCSVACETHYRRLVGGGARRACRVCAR